MKELYFVSWIACGVETQIGNCTVFSDYEGEELVQDIIDKVTATQPGAVVLGITKV